MTLGSLSSIPRDSAVWDRGCHERSKQHEEQQEDEEDLEQQEGRRSSRRSRRTASSGGSRCDHIIDGAFVSREARSHGTGMYLLSVGPFCSGKCTQ